MIKYILMFVFLFSTVFAKEVELNINYKVDDMAFEWNKVYTNAQNIQYKITRFEYYISEVKVNNNPVSDLYLLANAGNNTHSLGDLDVDNVNKIEFGLGVDADHNVGKDPNAYPAGHPLAPQNPSMHWGWSAGYRFWAIEGVSDPDGDGTFDKSFQYHVLGDDTYKTISLDTKSTEESGKLIVSLNVNIQSLISIIDMTDFGIFHGFANQYPKIAEFANNIIQSQSFVSSINTSISKTEDELKVYPNPVNDLIKIEGVDQCEYEILTLEGKSILAGNSFNSIEVESLSKGIYILKLVMNDDLRTIKFVKN